MGDLRWPLASDGPPALFGVDELVTPVRGTGRMSDLEFLHVTSKRVLNRVPPGSRAPTNWTINVYRGCSHACTYCLAGDTPILMADNRTTPLADVGRGDRVIGTREVNGQTRRVVTEVLDHWQTVKPGYRVHTDDGTTLTASADHRFRTDRGWAPVHGMVPGTRLVRCPPDEQAGRPAQRHDQDPRHVRLAPPPPYTVVTTVEALDAEVPLYDITTGTGDFIADGVVSHNCFARPTHTYLGLNIGADFDRKIVVKINAVERVRAELADPRWTNEAVAMGTNTDPYQRAEAKYRLTRGVVAALAEHGTPFSILTKSPLVTRDLDLIAGAAQHADVRVDFSIGTLDQRVWRATEPGSPNPRSRIEAMRRLADAGVRTGALVAPVLPGLSDSAEQLREVIDAVRGAGGEVHGLGPLYLKPGTREHFLAWLAGHDPAMHADYVRRYASSDFAPERYLALLHERAGLPRRHRGRYASAAPRRQ